MLKQFLAGASVSLLVLFAGSVSAQDASDLQSQPESAQQTAPESPEAQPPAPEAPQEQVSTPVNEEELQQFANAIPQLRELEQSAQQEIDQVIEQSGISPNRFGELYQAQQAPEAATGSNATPEEQQSFDQALSEIESILQETQSQQVDVIRSEGLEPERFSEILVAVRQDPSLQQQLQEIIQGN
ncbi:MAG: hypothetical protein Kow00121_32520 [Elainellaceae cyanobacterium]